MGIRYWKKRKRIRKEKRWMFLFLVLVLMTVFFAQRKQLFRTGKEELLVAGCEKITEFLTPVLGWNSNLAAKGPVTEMEMKLFPVLRYAAEGRQYVTDIESTLSYEMILAREALDENYVDEDGQVVLVNDVPEEADASFGQPDENIGQEGNNSLQASGETAGEADAQQEPAADSANPGGEARPAASAVIASGKAVEYSYDKLCDFDYLIQNFYQVDNTTTIKSDQLNIEALGGKNMKLSHDATTPQILIYHTHSQEAYADSVPGDPSTTVVGVGDYLAELLTNQYGFSVIHDRGQYDTVRDKAYSKAAPALEQILAQNPQIEVIIDLHRDGVGENTRLVTNINGTDMAKVMFFNGLSRTTAMGDISYLYNPYIADNLAFSFQMQLAASEYYPGYTRKIYLKGYRFNMHYRPKSLLVEVGAQTNTVQEAMNAMVPLADVLHKVLAE